MKRPKIVDLIIEDMEDKDSYALINYISELEVRLIYTEEKLKDLIKYLDSDQPA